ncbi:MAG: adenine deaminase C-terminal domain-containing protein [Armatimonadota bacterium]|nr:adenine deaminase C-terminal domain-containing protein [Armatimonadota bacterium]
MKRTFRTLDELRILAAVARGDRPPDLLLVGGQVLNVHSGEVYPATVAAAAGRIAYVGDRPIEAGPHTAVVDARGRLIAPGYIDPHAHPFATFAPEELARAALGLGTTGIVADTMPLLMLTPAEATAEAMAAMRDLPVRYFFFLRQHAQGHVPDEDACLSDDRLAALLAVEEVRTVGELTRWPQVCAGDETLLRRISRALAAGRRVEGHAPGASPDRLQGLAAAGVSSDHEALTADQALARLRAGLYVMLRHGSLRPDLEALAPVATGARAFSGRLMLTPDGPSPQFLRDSGYMDHLVATAMRAGIEPLAAYQMATLNPATYYGLDEELGGVAPGRRADLLLLEGLDAPRPETVITGGRIAAREGRVVLEVPRIPWERWVRPLASVPWRPGPEVFTLDGLPSPAPAAHLENTVITARRDLALGGHTLPAGVLHAVLLDPAGRWRCRTLLSGFGDRIGGLAASYTGGAGLLCVGRAPADMAVAAARVLDLGGGIVLAEEGAILFELPLPIGGMASPEPYTEVAAALDRLHRLLAARGYRHGEIAYTLLFFSFDALPYVRLTYRGLWDVVAGRVLIPREDLAGAG